MKTFDWESNFNIFTYYFNEDSLQGYSLMLFLGVFRNAFSQRGYSSPVNFAIESWKKDNSPSNFEKIACCASVLAS